MRTKLNADITDLSCEAEVKAIYDFACPLWRGAVTWRLVKIRPLKRERAELDSEEKHQRDLLRQVKAARLAAGEADEPVPTELKRDEVPGGKIALGSLLSTAGGKAKLAPTTSAFAADDDGGRGGGGAAGGGATRRDRLDSPGRGG